MHASRCPSDFRERLGAAGAFLAIALLSVLAGGFVSAIAAHAPTRFLMWMVAYLVLVAGVAQAVLGLGQAWLAERVPSRRWRIGEWVLFNAGNAGVIAGTGLACTPLVAVGTGLFVVALAAFLVGVRGAGAGHGWLLFAFRAVLVITCIGACVGLALSLAGVAR